MVSKFKVLIGLLALTNFAYAQNTDKNKGVDTAKPATKATAPTLNNMKKYEGYFNFYFE